MVELIVAQEHSQLYDLWIANNEKALPICHVDFHCDMRGLLINRKRGTARFINKHIPYIHRRDSGSFLTHAIMEGIVTQLRWVHHEYGGRKYDLAVVKYENDLTAFPHLFFPDKEVQIQYTEHTFKDWGGVKKDEHLDIDWDGIAFRNYDINLIRTLASEILNRVYPKDMPRVYLVNSPGYCHSDPGLFSEFIGQLENKFNTKAYWLPEYKDLPKISLPWKIIRKFNTKATKILRKLGYY